MRSSALWQSEDQQMLPPGGKGGSWGRCKYPTTARMAGGRQTASVIEASAAQSPGMGNREASPRRGQ